jgi:hypothetical protein
MHQQIANVFRVLFVHVTAYCALDGNAKINMKEISW